MNTRALSLWQKTLKRSNNFLGNSIADIKTLAIFLYKKLQKNTSPEGEVLLNF